MESSNGFMPRTEVCMYIHRYTCNIRTCTTVYNLCVGKNTVSYPVVVYKISNTSKLL